jgi:hypothetical protein
MRLRNKSNFDLHYDIKNIVELKNKIEFGFADPSFLMKIMLKEIEDLNKELAFADTAIEALHAAALEVDNNYLASIGQKPI